MEAVCALASLHHGEQGKKEGSWAGMRKYLEEKMLCSSLRGRVRYQLDLYPKLGTCGNTFTVVLDGKPLLKCGFDHAYSEMKGRGQLTEERPYPWHFPFSERSAYFDSDFSQALAAYRNQPIQASLESENPLIRMFAIVDRRVGKRTLQKMIPQVKRQPAWLYPLYLARFQAEGFRLERQA